MANLAADRIELRRDCEVIAVPSGQRQTLPAGTPMRIVQTRGGAFTVSNDIHAIFRIDGADADALGLAPPKSSAVPTQGPLTDEMVWKALKNVFDPELPVNVVDLGLIYACDITTSEQGGKTIAVRMAMTSPGCGMSNVLKADVGAKLNRLPEVTEVKVDVVFDPPWSPARMSEAARLQLGMDLDDSRGPGLIQIGRF
jgi:probable FeS assembly SUF system protein SufT